MACLEENIIKKIIEKDERTSNQQFSLKDLIGERVTGNRSIDLQAESEKTFTPGRYVEILDFESGRALAWFEEGLEDETITHAYLIEPLGTARYTEDLFSPDTNRLS